MGRNMVDGWWTGKQNEGAKTIDIVSYALTVSESSPFHVIRYI